MTNVQKIKAWAVLGGKSNKGGFQHVAGYPQIYIQKTKPVVWWQDGVGSKPYKAPVVRVEITYTLP